MVVRPLLAGSSKQFANFRKIALFLIAAAMVVVGMASQAQANPRYAAYVIDARTGQVLFSRNADARRYPASLTKMMTVYMLLDALESGRVTKSTPIPISAKASAEVPTKIGLRPGATITVDNAIKALIVRSANDIATAVAEHLGGTEAAFARDMTATARRLGMNSTQFRNAHGLPNQQQYTTARDMAILGIALREHFPQHYSYFSTRSFSLGRNSYNTHNRMLGRIQGVDGIKTGFIRASGFNLVSSVQQNGRSVVGVVMGGQSARSRDDHMAALIREHLPRASRSGGGPLVAARRPSSGGRAVAVAAAPSLPQQNIPLPSFRPRGKADIQMSAYVQPQATNAAVAAAAALPANTRPAAPVPVPAAAPAAAPASSASDERFGVDPVTTSAVPASGWAVQIASSPSRNEALSALVRMGKEASGILGDSNAFIEEFRHRGTTYYRARFGFASQGQASTACNALKKRRIDCFAAQL